MASQTGKQIIKIRILLPNISRNKGNQIMKNCQLTEYNMRHIFLKKLHTKCGREANSRGFYKKSKLSIYLDQMSEILWSFFIVCSSRGLPKYIKTKVLVICSYPILSFLKKQKEVWNLSLYLISCMIFEEKYFSCYIILFSFIVVISFPIFDTINISIAFLTRRFST